MRGKTRAVSAIPLPKPEPETPGSLDDERARTGSDEDGWALLEALRRRLDDQVAQGRKTQVQVSQLAESIGALVGEQRRRSKWLNLNSFVAYVIFTVVVSAGFYALYRSRANELVAARDTARHERDLAVHRADEATAKLAAREKADAIAWDAYELLEAGKRTEAQAKLAAVGPQALSRTERAVLAARAHETQVQEVEAALKAAAASFKAGRYGDVIAPLEAALVGEPAGPRSGAMHYFVGVAYAKANDLAKAIEHLQIAVATDTDHDDARFQLASALDRSGQYAKARAQYDQFATAHPQLGLAVYAMRRSATLARMPAVAPKASGGAPNANGAAKGAAPADSATKPAPKWPAQSTAPTTAPKPTPTTGPQTTPTKPTAAPTPVESEPAPAQEGSAAVTPMSTTPFDMKEGMSTADGAPPASTRDDRRAISIDRGQSLLEPMTTTPIDLPANLEPMSTSSVERKPAREPPSTNIGDKPRERTPTEIPPAPKAGTAAPVMPPAPPTDRAPPPTSEPPIDREPAPAPRTPPRGETTPRHERF